MRVPSAVLRVVDPAGVALRDRRPGRRRRGPVYQGGAVFGLGVAGGSRQATPDELAEMARRHADRRADRDARIEAARGRYAESLRPLVDRLLAGEAVALEVSGGRLDARVRRFWRGDSVLETDWAASGQSCSSRTRMPRSGPRLPELILDYLLVQMAAGDRW